MICDVAAEYISALCDGETIPPEAAQHIASCAECEARLGDYLAMGVELRRSASLGLAEAVLSRTWTKPHSHVATWWQRGWGTMRIPRVAFAVLVAGILVLTSALIAHKVRAHDTGTVVLLSTTFPNGLIEDGPLSTQDRDRATFSFYGDVGSQYLAYKVRLLSLDGSRVRLAIRTRTYPIASVPPPKVLYAFERDTDPAREVWFEPGEPLKFDVPKVGTLILKGEWMDHLPVLGTLDPAPNELRLGRPLLLKDKTVVGDLSIAIGGVYGQDQPDQAMAFYIPGEGRFLISQLPMKGALEAHVDLGRISFKDDGHSWELVSGVPVCRADHVWVLHQPDVRIKATGPFGGNHIAFGNTMLVQTESGVWVPQDWPK